MQSNIELDIPEAFLPLLDTYRYKVMYGGRASTKSWTISRILLMRAVQRKCRILCAREIQNSIQESVHSLLEDQINLLGLEDEYDIQKTAIYGKNGSEFFFSGLKHKIDSLKSVEGCDYCWVEEAHTVSRTSWNKLIPTIRKDGSEIWISFNPELFDDETYQRFVVHQDALENAWVKHVTYKDNPWFNEVMQAAVRETRARSEDEYLNIWLGHTRQALEGAVYAAELRQAQSDGRICSVPYNKGIPVNAYFDIGYNDATAIWFIQKVGVEYHVIDYYENQLKDVEHYVRTLKEKPYLYGDCFLPFDAESTHPSGIDYRSQFEALMNSKARIVPKDRLENGINALRLAFNKLWFDEKNCADGLHALRHYHYEIDDKRSTTDRMHLHNKPEHDWSSHAADSLRYWAMSDKAPREKPQLKLVKKPTTLSLGSRANTSWMGR